MSGLPFAVSILPVNESKHNQGTLLERLTWKEAEPLLTKEAVVVIPLGAQCKEHGLHLPLNNDWLLAEYLKEQVVERLSVIVAPTVNYSYFPMMMDYPGTVSLRIETASAMFVDIVKSLSRFGTKKFYFLNTGISTIRPLNTAREQLEKDGLIVHYTDLRKVLDPSRTELEEQDGGTHADEIETSIMLFIAPQIVKMERAQKDYHPGSGPLSRTETEGTVFSPTGAWGNPTLASKAKGEKLVNGLLDGITRDITELMAM